jgi:hypothetical protein
VSNEQVGDLRLQHLYPVIEITFGASVEPLSPIDGVVPQRAAVVAQRGNGSTIGTQTRKNNNWMPIAVFGDD